MIHNARVHRVRLFALLCLAVPLSAYAANSTRQDYLIKVWGADDGLTEGSVTDVAQTPEGYLWVGTLFGSVLRFDGRRFVSYNSANTHEFSQKWGVPRLMVDKEGTLWISMYDGGMTAWDKQGFRAVFTSTNQPGRLLWSAPGRVLFLYGEGRLLSGKRRGERIDWEILSLSGALPQDQCCADAEGRVYYLRSQQQIGIWDDGQIRVCSLAADLAGQQIKVLAEARGTIWMGTDKALAQWQTDHFEPMIPTNGEPVLNVKRIVSSGSSNIWVEANGRMRRFVGRQWVAESEGWKQELGRRNSLRFLHGDSKGGLWSSAGDLGLIHVLADGSLHRLTTREGMPSDTLSFAFQDREGDTWTGYERGGLVQIRHRLFHSIGKDEGLSDSLINTVCEDAQGAIWIGTHRGSVDRFEQGGCTNLALTGSGRIQDSCVAADTRGRVWMGAQGSGLWKWDAGNLQQIATQEELQGYPRLLAPGKEGRMWVGTLWSIFNVTDERITAEFAVQTTGDHPTSLAEGPDGTVWAGTLAGELLRREGEKFVRLEPPERTTLGRVWALWPTADGGLWAGTEQGGLVHWNNGVFHRFTTKDGLPSDSIVQVLGDAAGNLWLGTRAGIVRILGGALARFERGELEELPVSVYGQTDGLLTIGSAIIYQPNCWRARDGTFLFAMANSIASVRPEEVRINPVPPTVVVEELLADDKVVWPKQVGAILAAPEAGAAASAETRPTAVKVGPGRGDLEFHYTGLSLASPMRVRFKYKLEGLENAWNDAGPERKAIYRHVSPGEYTFHVMACNSDSVWSQDSELFAVTVKPFFYQTVWFRAGLGLLAVSGLSLALVSASRKRMRRRLEHVERQHELERERTRIAQDLHDDLGAGLTEIGLLSGMLQDPVKLPERRQEALSRIAQRCRDLVTALDEIVWAINPRNDSVNSLSGYLSRYSQGFLEPTSIRCRLEVEESEPDRPLNSEQRHNLFLAFEEALTNVVRHSGASEVRIKISCPDSKLSINVHDNGRGLPANGTDGGDGLNNLRQRLAHIGGQCEISSPPSGGVSVRLNLPLEANRE
jgi:signal transduction histidine kinase/ligand-binding sensor domain-containing protein